MTNIDALRALAHDALEDKADFDEVLAEISRHIDGNPEALELLHLLELRILLNDAAYDRVAVWEDRKRLLTQRPDDLDLTLLVLEAQYFWSTLLAEHECAPQLEAAGAFRLDEADEEEAIAIEASPAYQAAQSLVLERSDALSESAIFAYIELMAKHAHHIDDAKKIRTSWDDRIHWLPWHNYLLILSALQVQPHAALYRKWEALYLAALAKHEEDGLTKVASGYFVDQVLGNFHARTTYDALDAIAAIEGHENDYELLAARAELQQALADYAAAAVSQRQIATVCEGELAKADASDSEMWQVRLADAKQAALHCDGGSKMVQESHIASVGESLMQAQAQVQDMQDRMRERMGNHYTPSRKPNFAEIMGSLNSWQDKVDDLTSGPTEETKIVLREKAAKLAASTAGLVKFTPVQFQAMDRSEFTSSPSPWFDEIELVLREANLEFAGWFQNLQNVAALKKEAPGQLWLAPGHEFIVTAEATDKVRLKRCLTEFSDGSILITADARGGGYYSSGPMVDSFHVFKSTPLAEMIAVHQARLRAKLARHPELQAMPAGSVARAQEIEAGMKRHTNAFRIRHGITEPEIRGMNVQHHEFFATELKREMADRIAQIVVPE